MSDTTYANYQNFGTYASEIAQKGSNAYSNVKNAYDKIKSLNNPAGWRGEKYDGLVECFNNMVTDFNNIFSDLQYAIPKALRNIAAQFASFDSSSFYEATADADSLASIPASGEKALTWTISAVSAAKTEVENKFKDAKDDVAAIKSVVQNMNSDWSGETYNDLREAYFTHEVRFTNHARDLFR